MISLLPYYMIKSLLLTVLFECALAFLLKTRKPLDLATVALAQAVTNPVVVVTNYLITVFIGMTAHYIALAVLEISAFLTEALIYRKLKTCRMNPFLFSFILNLFSFTAGEIINRL
ncbi:MAG: hypothetical protein K6F64_00685 [Clostridia bacterium]|nr:hypothetical protein [Clostridia bacterium]